MWTLRVSFDAGGSYYKRGESGSVVELLSLAEPYEQQGLRWVIENEQGDFAEISGRHKAIIASLAAVVRKAEALPDEEG